MKKLTLVLPVLMLNACAYNSTMGENDRFQVASTASFFAPSVTTVLDTKTDSAATYAGPSIVGQVANAAGTVAGGYLLGVGIGKSGTTVSQTGGGASSSSISQSNAAGGIGGTAISGSSSGVSVSNRLSTDIDVSIKNAGQSGHH